MRRVAACLLAACTSASEAPPPPGPSVVVAAGDDLVRLDLGTGRALAAPLSGFAGAASPVAIGARLLVAAPAADQLAVVTASPFVVAGFLPASLGPGRAPTGLLVGPDQAGRARVAVLNAGRAASPGSSSVRLLDLGPDGQLHAYGELFLGAGPHAAAFSRRLDRVVVTTRDCAALLVVIDFADAGRIRRVAGASDADLGLEPGSCAAARPALPEAPDACAPLGLGRALCTLPGLATVALTIDAAAPSFEVVLGAESAALAARPDASLAHVVVSPLALVTFSADAGPPVRSPLCPPGADPTCLPGQPALLGDGRLLVPLGSPTPSPCSRTALLADPASGAARALGLGAGTRRRTLALSPDGALAVVANDLESSMTPIELPSGSVRAALSLAGSPSGLAVLPAP